MNHKTYRQLLVLFFLSGATSLAYETVFVKLLGYVFGSTTYAVSTILAAFMGGLAAGSYFFGRYVDRGRDGLKLYAYLELGVGIYCTFVPLVFRGLEPLYVTLYQKFHFSLPALTLVRFLLSSVLVLPPTLLMGGTLPALAKSLVAKSEHIGERLSALYAINTFGAAFGVFSVTFFILGTVGIYGTLGLAVLGNLVICGLALYLRQGHFSSELVKSAEIPMDTFSSEHKKSWFWELCFDRVANWLVFDWSKPSDNSSSRLTTRLNTWLFTVAFLTGVISFAYEVTWTHVLAQTVGTSAYAFGTMLTTMLLGIALGSHLVKKVIDEQNRAEMRLALAQVFLGVVVLALVPLWDNIPKLFKLTRYFRPNFELTESIRFLGCFAVMFLPALLIGIGFPLLMRVQARQLPNLAQQVGTIYFFNTIGCITGSTLTGFLILPHLGSEWTMRAAAILNIGLGVLIAVVFLANQRRFLYRLIASALVFSLASFWLIPHWNLNQLNVGAHVLNNYVEFGHIIFYQEDVLGGVTSVVQSGDNRTLLANAKFQGNDTNEVPAQKQIALVPMIFTQEQERALVIGLGTGTTASAVAAFPFKEVDIAELSPGIVQAAHDYYGHVNGKVLDDPRVHVHVTDGRNFVLLTPTQYDLITIELTNIWFAGAANLYSQDFYKLCRARLKPHGIFQQWVQVHHIDTIDLLSVIKTMHTVFPHVGFFLGGGQGILIGSEEPLEIDFPKASALNKVASVQKCFQDAHVTADDILSVLGGLYLYEDNVTKTLESEPSAGISTDWYPLLEYTTPRGNQLPYSHWGNLKFLEVFRYTELPRVKNISETQRLYLQGLVAASRGELHKALSLTQKSLEQGNRDERCPKLLNFIREQLAQAGS